MRQERFVSCTGVCISLAQLSHENKRLLTESLKNVGMRWANKINVPTRSEPLKKKIWEFGETVENKK